MGLWKRITSIALAIWLAGVAVPQRSVEAAVNSNFDSFASGTPVESLAIPGATFDGGGHWCVTSNLFTTMTGNILIEDFCNGGASSELAAQPLTITFSTDQSAYNFRFATSDSSQPDLQVLGYLDGGLVINTTFTGTIAASGFPEGAAAGSGTNFDTLMISSGFELAAIDNLSTIDAATTPPPGGSTTSVEPPLYVPNLGLVRIDVKNTQPVFQSPGGPPILRGSSLLLLPHDFDGNGFDTYTVTKIVQFNGENWVGIFLGSGNWGYVPLANVVPITVLP